MPHEVEKPCGALFVVGVEVNCFTRGARAKRPPINYRVANSDKPQLSFLFF